MFADAAILSTGISSLPLVEVCAVTDAFALHLRRQGLTAFTIIQ
jgi:hypothetical protein